MPKLKTTKDFTVSRRYAERNKRKSSLTLRGSKYGQLDDRGFGAGRAELVGDWENFRQWLGLDSGTKRGIYIIPGGKLGGKLVEYNYAKFENKIELALERAAKRSADLLEKEIKNGLKSGAPGGQKLQPLSSTTIKMRQGWAKQGGHKAKSWVGRKSSGYFSGQKPLMRTGDLYRSISKVILEKGEFFVGIPEGAENREGTSLTMIGTVMEKGMALAVSQKVANYFAAMGVPLKDTTSHIIISPRPFISPVFKENRAEIYKIYKEELRFVLFEEVFGHSPQKIKYFRSKLKTYKSGGGKYKKVQKKKSNRPRGRPPLPQEVKEERERKRAERKAKQKEKKKRMYKVSQNVKKKKEELAKKKKEDIKKKTTEDLFNFLDAEVEKVTKEKKSKLAKKTANKTTKSKKNKTSNKKETKKKEKVLTNEERVSLIFDIINKYEDKKKK